MTPRFFKFVIILLVGSLYGCNSDQGEIETVIKNDEPGTVVYTEWKAKNKEPETIALKKEEPPPQKLEPAPKPLEEQPAKPSLKSIDSGFMLQLGAFLNKKNADNLTKKLSNASDQPFMTSSESKGKLWHIVHLGPFKTEDDAVKKAQTIASAEKMSVLLLRNGKSIRTIKPEVAETPPKQTKKPEETTTAKASVNATTTQKKTDLKSDPMPSSPKKKEVPKQETTTSKPVVASSEGPYSFQIGGLYSAENAKSQLKRYQLRGYKPYLVEVEDEATKEIWYSIRIGKFSTLNEAVDEAAIFSSKEQIPTHPRPLAY